MKEKDETVEIMRQRITKISLDLIDERNKMQMKETALLAMQERNNQLQQENERISQSFLNEQSTVEMLRDTLSLIYNGVRQWVASTL